MLQNLISNEIPLETAGMSSFKNSAKLRRKYQFTSRYGDPVHLYHEDPEDEGLIWLPRGLFPVGDTDNRFIGKTIEFPKEPEPRPYQVGMFDEIRSAVKQKHNGVFVAPTGWGKTVLGFLLAYLCGVKTCVVTTKSDIYKQWLKGAHEILGIPKDRIGEIRQDKCEIVGTDFCVALVQSMSKEGKYPDHVFEQFGLVIFDECHRMPADQFSSIIGKFPAMYRYGLSATPNRKDGRETLFYANIGPIRAKAPEALMIPNVLRFKTEWRCPRRIVVMKNGEKKVRRLSHEPGKMGQIEKILAVDDERNRLIAKTLSAAYHKGRHIAVFSTQHLHLTQVEHALHKLNIPKKDIGWYVSASTKAEKQRQEEAKLKPLMLTTYQMMGEGTSIDWLDTAALIMPRSDIVQPVGRIRREFDGKRFPLVLDFVDTDSHVLRGYAKSRMDWYEEIGAKVEDMF